jgi:hypothetical protein
MTWPTTIWLSHFLRSCWATLGSVSRAGLPHLAGGVPVAGGQGVEEDRSPSARPKLGGARWARKGALWPGRPYPLGATWDGAGVNFALCSTPSCRAGTGRGSR